MLDSVIKIGVGYVPLCDHVIYGCDKHIERVTYLSRLGKGMARRFLLWLSITQKRQKITGSAK